MIKHLYYKNLYPFEIHYLWGRRAEYKSLRDERLKRAGDGGGARVRTARIRDVSPPPGAISSPPISTPGILRDLNLTPAAPVLSPSEIVRRTWW